MTSRDLLRADQRLIAELIPEGARVLDLGCGDGTLLERLRERRGAIVRGVEIDLANVARCIERDVPVYQSDLDEGLADIPDGRFDVVILSQTLQVVKRPRLVLTEMLRVGGRSIVSFPNFGHWRVRAHLALRGRMPVSDAIPYSWYDTPNIHHTTIADFRDFAADCGAVVEREIAFVGRGDGRTRLVRALPNLLADEAVFVLKPEHK
jgi:methionine biosynthesis protein MetW